jgi:hypothetical protein
MSPEDIMFRQGFQRREVYAMRKLSLLTLIVVFAGATGCSSISVNYDYDHSADFSGYESFAWVPQPEVKQRNPLVYNRVVKAASEHLIEKGMVEDRENPDFLIAMHAGTQDRIDVTDWGYRYHGWGMVSRDVSVHQYQEGTLVLDVIDAETRDLVWRGSATKTIDSNATAEKREENLRTAIGKLLNDFPPGSTR